MKNNKKLLVWIMGSNATGKTTQSRLLHEALSDWTPKVHEPKTLITEQLAEGITVKATIYEQSAHIGHFKDNQCTGTDTINSKEGVDAAFCYLMNNEHISYIVVDGILCTATWIDIFKQFPESVTIMVVLLQFNTLEENLKRVVERRVYKMIDKGGNDLADIEMFDYYVEDGIDNLEEKTLKNIGSKFKNFKSMYNRVKDKCDFSMEIDASLTQEEIHEKIIQAMLEID